LSQEFHDRKSKNPSIDHPKEKGRSKSIDLRETKSDRDIVLLEIALSPEEKKIREHALSNCNIRFIDIKPLLYDPRYIMHAR